MVAPDFRLGVFFIIFCKIGLYSADLTTKPSLMSSKRFFICLVICYSFLPLSAQEKPPVKFGNVSAKDFATTIHPIDSNAHAVVIADIGTSTIEGNNKNSVSIFFKRYKRVHILNKNGFDVANVSIYLVTNGDDEEELERLKAITYNLENGKVVETKLDTKNGVFKEKLNRQQVVKKFTLPNIKEGSIIEFEYTVKSDFFCAPRSLGFPGYLSRYVE